MDFWALDYLSVDISKGQSDELVLGEVSQWISTAVYYQRQRSRERS